jgi:hypothetical protein
MIICCHVGVDSCLFHIAETLIYIKRYIDVSAPDMSFKEQADHTPSNTLNDSATYPALLQLPRPLLDYRVIIAITKGDVGAVNILQDVLTISKNLYINNVLLALGPTTPISLRPPSRSRILWATFSDGVNLQSGTRLTIVPPTNLTDVSLNLDKLSKTKSGRIPLIVGDFLDNVLSVSTVPAGLYSFLCKLFTRIRTNGQTAFLMVTEDMHDSKKTAILKRFADVIIEYKSKEEGSDFWLEARILDQTQNQCNTWESHHLDRDTGSFLESRIFRIGRPTPFIQEPISLVP